MCIVESIEKNKLCRFYKKESYNKNVYYLYMKSLCMIFAIYFYLRTIFVRNDKCELIG